ncbi:conserved hypothetical protein [Culex quinquefasciatus]|uniref:Retrovirus-related Pol polyprotein from transposon TNT 1-94-like beta-barrel domain-containing protein n=1 Tax=Culex quinquefasciatus TaxID=7176 RepID=B0W7U6_CULQU|nr:conserved hypothetical protein [Culex quinquefasciatus]|eukprot:XP_001844780.1 conserved hypothetical protein [Culex quinquefasciatus]
MEYEFVSHAFDGTNFSCWSFRIEADLKAQKLHHCIERTLEEEESFFTVVAEEGVAERVRKEALQKSRKKRTKSLIWEALEEVSKPESSACRKQTRCRKCAAAKKGKVHAAESTAGAEEDVLFVPEAEEANNEEANGKFRWVLDSDVSDHMVGDWNLLVNVRRMETPKVVNVAEAGVTLESHFVGEVKMKAGVGKRTLNFTVHDVLYVPGLTTNLFSVEKVAERGMEVSFGRNHARISKDGDVKCTATRYGSLFVLDVELEMCGSDVVSE